MEIAQYSALHTQCLQLCHGYFISATNAPVMYQTLGRTLETLGFALERLCMEASHPKSRLVHPSTRRPAEKILWLALYKLSALFVDIENLLRRLKVTQDKPPQWWLNFAQRARFDHQKSFAEFIQRVDFHTWGLKITTKTFNGALLTRKLETFSLWADTLESVLQQQFSKAYATLGNEGGSIRSAVDQNVDIVEEFIASSDYHDGRDIFEVANIMTMVRLAMYWTHRGADGLTGIEKTRSLPVESYANILKAGWVIQRLQIDKRSRSEECNVIIGSLIEDVIFQLKRVNELNMALPTNQQLVQEADLRIWLDDLEDNEAEIKSHRESIQSDSISPLFSRGEKTDPVWPQLWQQGSPDVILKTSDLPTSPSQVSVSEAFRSPDSRTTNATFPSSIEAQQSSTLSHHSSQSSSASSNPVARKQLPRARLPTLTEPLERPPSLQPNSMQFGVPPLHSHSSSRELRAEATRAGNELPPSLYAKSPNVPRKHPSRSPNLNVSPNPNNVSDLEAYDPSNPPSEFGGHRRQSIRDEIPPSPIGPDPRDLDERPGELEIMKECFRSMKLSASETFEVNPQWESCSIRIFRRADSDARILTFRDSKIDQRFISLKDTEIVPEYGYHNDCPVIYLRKSALERYKSSVTTRELGAEDPSVASLYYRFGSAKDMFNFQLAFTGEAVEIDIKAVRTVRFKRNLLDGEHSNYKARVQLWREQTFPTVAGGVKSPFSRSVSGTIRSQGITERVLKVPTTRMVIFFEDIMVFLFVTDSIAIESRARTNVIRIKPSSWSTFRNPNSVRARFLGARRQSGGLQLDKKGLTYECEDDFDEFKWFELDFFSEEDMSSFRNDFGRIIAERREERHRVNELKRLAATGARSSR